MGCDPWFRNALANPSMTGPIISGTVKLELVSSQQFYSTCSDSMGGVEHRTLCLTVCLRAEKCYTRAHIHTGCLKKSFTVVFQM
jgi:hypothetical protein